MGWLEIVLLCAVGLWLTVTVIFLAKRRGKGCCGCNNCNACEYRENCTESKRE